MKKRRFFKGLEGKIVWKMMLVSLVPIIAIGIFGLYKVAGSVQATEHSVRDSRTELSLTIAGMELAAVFLTSFITIRQSRNITGTI